MKLVQNLRSNAVRLVLVAGAAMASVTAHAAGEATFDTSAILAAITAVGVAVAAIGAAVAVLKFGVKAWRWISSAG